MKKNRFLTFAIFLSVFVFLYGEEKLNYLNTSWSGVIPGTVITEPAITSYGFCLATDGKMISAFSNDGKLLWEENTRSSRNISITAIHEDFIMLWDKRWKEIKLLNPSGSEIWSKKLTYNLNKKPFPGRDGRIFLTGDKIIECYGINGIRKWSLKTDLQKDLNLQELPDGSLILFLGDKEGKTNAIRISPFGKIIEEITFAGEVKKAFTTNDGVFLIFTDGSAGMFSVIDNLSKNKWVIPKNVSNSTLAVSQNNYLYLELYKNYVVVNKIRQSDGAISFSYEIPNINGLDLQILELTNNGLFIADSHNCYLYGDSGNKKWTAVMPENKGSGKWNYVIYTQDNHLIFCLENWSINAYLTSQGLGKRIKTNKSTYKQYYKIDTSPMDFLYTEKLDANVVSEERNNILGNGDYGEKEVIYTSDIFSIVTSYLMKTGSSKGVGRKKLSVFDKDSNGFESIINQLGLLGTADSASYMAKMLNQTTNLSYIQSIFNSISLCGYDPEGKILEIMELIVPKINYKEKRLLESACDAVYSICLFMGRPAFNLIGKDILKDLLFPKYDIDTNEYATKTLQKIVNLEL